MIIAQASPRYIVVVGASAGGLNSLIELAAQLTEEMDIAVFAVLHLSHISSPEVIVQRIQKNTVFVCQAATDGGLIASRHLYLAPPDHHLFLKGDRMKLGKGTAENRWRPSIDVLFRSAAACYDGRTIGIVLTGLMQDGASGMQAIERCGGTTIVQDPTEAEYPDMPLAVLDQVKVDYCSPLAAIGNILLEKSRQPLDNPAAIPAEIKKEAELSERVVTTIEELQSLGEKSLYSCPDCSGGLWEIVSGGVTRYRCHTGHTYSEADLLIRQGEALENTLWVALRMLEERKNLLVKMAKEERSKGWLRMSAAKESRAAELEVHIERLKNILFQSTEESATRTG